MVLRSVAKSRLKVSKTAAVSNVDEQYIYISGSFGRLEIGTDNGAPYRMHYGVKSNGIGIDEGDVTNWVAGCIWCSSALQASPLVSTTMPKKITYFSPRVNGFQVGATYMPKC